MFPKAHMELQCPPLSAEIPVSIHVSEAPSFHLIRKSSILGLGFCQKERKKAKSD